MNYKDIAREVVARQKTITEDNAAGFLDSLLVLDEYIEDFDLTLEDIKEFVKKGIMATLFTGWINVDGENIAYEPEEKDNVWHALRGEYLGSLVEAAN